MNVHHTRARLIGLGVLTWALVIGVGSGSDIATPELPDTPAGKLLASWLVAHNRADEASLEAWVQASYLPEPADPARLASRVAWYLEATGMFGELHPTPHLIMENEPHRLVAQFLSVELQGQDPLQLDPTKIVIVEVDVDPDRPGYLKRGLGLGSLACELRR